MKSMQKVILILLFLLVSACAHYPVNPPLEDINTFIQEAEIREFRQRRESEQLLLILAFSGGGTRAAALSYGVLEALKQVEVPFKQPTGSEIKSTNRAHSMLDEVDFISSVSGGSFTAAYYGLHGKKIFDDFRERFLTYPVQRGLLMRVLLAPPNWFRLMSRNFGKSDLAAEYYDKILFDGATFGDIDHDGPMIRIQATDMANDFAFSFTPPQFGLLCANLEQFPVSRAVAASAAFPGPFTPITLRNYAGQCGMVTPEWIERALKEKETYSRDYHTARKMAAYLDAENRQYIHLMDGGIIDNLGVRGPTEILSLAGDIEQIRESMEITEARRVAIVVVNASAPRKKTWGLRSSIRALGDIIGLTSAIMVEGSNFDTMDLLRRYLKQWEEMSAQAGSSRIAKKTYLIEVGFDALVDEEEKASYADIPTALQLPEEAVDRLRSVAGRILYNSSSFQDLVREIGGRIPEPHELPDSGRP